MKKYSSIEVLEMLKNNKDLEFVCINSSFNVKKIISIDSYGYILLNNVNCSDGISGNLNIDDVWSIKENAVTFEEALNCNKKIRVEHKHIDSCNVFINETMQKYWYKLKNGEYLKFDELLCVLSWRFSSKTLKEIIKNGNWYIES